MKYLKKFNNHTDYTEYMSDSPLLPNVSYCVTQDEVHFNGTNTYLTFEIVSAGTVTVHADSSLNTKTISYSTDDGTTWTQITTTDTAQSLGTFAVGDRIMFKGVNDAYGTSAWYQGNEGVFGGTASFNAYGNMMSLIYGDNFLNQYTLTSDNEYCFARIFWGSNIVSAEELILPATTLAGKCYYSMFTNCTSLTKAPALPALTLTLTCYGSMFSGCTSLTTAPDLPALTLTQGCYSSMFKNCSALNSVKMLATDVTANNCVLNWLNNVSATGTFIKNANAQWTEADVIPSGWTVQTA